MDTEAFGHRSFFAKERFYISTETGAGVKTLFIGKKRLCLGKTPLYWFKAPVPKLFGHEADQQTFVPAQSCFGSMLAKKVETPFISTWKLYSHLFLLENCTGFGCLSLRDWTVLKKNNGCREQKYSKMTKRAESGIEDKWCRKSFLTGKAEINTSETLQVCSYLYIFTFILVHFFSPLSSFISGSLFFSFTFFIFLSLARGWCRRGGRSANIEVKLRFYL